MHEFSGKLRFDTSLLYESDGGSDDKFYEESDAKSAACQWTLNEFAAKAATFRSEISLENVIETFSFESR